MFNCSKHHQTAGTILSPPPGIFNYVVQHRDVRVTQCFERLLRVFYAFLKSISRLSTKYFVNTERTMMELAWMLSVILGRQL